MYDRLMVMRESSRHAVIACLVALVSLAACSGSSDDTATEGDSEASSGETAEVAPDVESGEYAGVASIDRRPAILSELGSPDSFVITVDEIDGVISVFESWTYYDARTQIDLIDGEVLWDMEIEPLPEGSWLAVTFSPTEFTMLASRDETMAALGAVALTQIDATDTDVAGAELWAGEQLLLGFVDDTLVYVETFAAAPVDPEVVS